MFYLCDIDHVVIFSSCVTNSLQKGKSVFCFVTFIFGVDELHPLSVGEER